VCIQIKGRNKFLIHKLNSLWKHVGHCEVLVAMPWMKKEKHYFLKNNIHVVNEKLYFAKGFETML